MSLIDDVIAAASPRWAARRELERARLAGAQLTRSRVEGLRKRYSESFRIDDPSSRVGGRASRRGPMSKADRERLWRMFRYNPFARKAMNTLLNNVIGYGIIGSPVKPTRALRKDWADWIKVCDWDGVLDFYGIQELLAKSFFLDGCVFIVLRIADGVTGNPLRLQVLSVDQLASPYGSTGAIENGIEFEKGRPVAYHFRTTPVTGHSGIAVKTERIPAKDVIHFFERPAPGYWWGWPHFEPCLDALDGVDDYLESEGVRKRIESCFTAMVTRSIDADPSETIGNQESAGPSNEDGDELRAESFYPGMIMYGEPGENIKFGEPKAAGGLAEFLRWGGIRAAAGAQVTYEGLTGDLSNVNFTSYRAGANEFKRFVGRLQWTVGLIPRVLDPIWTRFCTVQVETGRMPDRQFAIGWTPPAFETIDPQGDAQAAILEMEAGLESRRGKLGERGYDHDAKMEEIAQDRATTKRLGLAFKGDPVTSATDQKTGDANDGDATADG